MPSFLVQRRVVDLKRLNNTLTIIRENTLAVLHQSPGNIKSNTVAYGKADLFSGISSVLYLTWIFLVACLRMTEGNTAGASPPATLPVPTALPAEAAFHRGWKCQEAAFPASLEASVWV